MRPLAREPACADREPDAPERWNKGDSGRTAVGDRRPAAKRARRSIRSLISAMFILNTRSEDGQRETPPDSLCSRHATSPSARPISGHPSRRHQRLANPRARFCAGWPLTAGPLRLGSGAGLGGRAGCPNTATPEHIPSAILSYGAGQGFARRIKPVCPAKFLMFPICASGGTFSQMRTAFRSAIVK
jgi:hypothetical protein